MSAADAARIGTGLAFVVMPLVFVFAFAGHPALLHPQVLRPERLIDRSRGRRLLHAGHGLVAINTALMIVIAVHLGRIVSRDGAGWQGWSEPSWRFSVPSRWPPTRVHCG